MKRYAIIGLLLLLIGAFVLVPLLKDSGEDPSETEISSTFNFNENLETTFAKAVPIAFTVNVAGVKKVELIYNDSIFKTWKAPKKGSLSFLLNADCFGVGTRYIVVRTTLADGSVEEDERMLRVVSDIAPKPMTATVVASFPHNTLNYTQGLEFNNGQLYEGTGDPGQQGATTVGKISLSTGEFGPKKILDATYFGEGITVFGDELFQLTWKNGKCFVYDKNTMELKKDFTYTGQGWGLCNDGKQLIMSDGSERITFRDPKTFSILRTIEVYDDNGPFTNINELEYIKGKIYANVYMTNLVLVIDPYTGKVLEEIDASALALVGKMGGEVLNGIAYDPKTNKIYMTGKYWGKILEVTISE